MSLIGKWDGQDNAASTTVLDSSGNGNNGTLTNAGNTSAISVADGPGTTLVRSLELDGSNDYVQIGNTLINTSSPWSAMAWIKPDVVNSGNKVIFEHNGRLFYIRGASQKLAAWNSSTERVASGSPLVSVGIWQHVAICWDGTNVKMYLDGVQVNSSAMTFTNGTASSSGFGGPSTATFDGRMCGMRLYNSDESANIATIMAEKDSSSGPPRLLMTTNAYMAGQR